MRMANILHQKDRYLLNKCILLSRDVIKKYILLLRRLLCSRECLEECLEESILLSRRLLCPKKYFGEEIYTVEKIVMFKRTS